MAHREGSAIATHHCVEKQYLVAASRSIVSANGNVSQTAGDFNPAAEEVWFGKIKRSLSRPAGERRIHELLNITEAVQANGVTRLKIYPAKDPRVLDVIRKIVVGLCHPHDIVTALSMKRIWADVQLK